MRESYSSLEKKNLFDKMVIECVEESNRYLQSWVPVNKAWDTIEGVVYIRVSSFKQVLKDKGSLIQQVHIAVQEAITRSHQTGVNYRIVRFAIEPGYSGTTENRPALQRMCWELKEGRYEFIMVRELSRIMRSVHFWLKFFEICKKAQCEIIVRNRSYNMNNPADVKELDNMAQAAAHESKMIGERTKDVNHTAAKIYGKLNGTKLVLGLDQIIEDGKAVVGKYEVNKEEIKVVEWIMRSFIKYGSYPVTLREIENKKITNKTGIPFTDSSLKTLLTNKKYIGKWVLNEKNKQFKQEKLMPYDRHEIIDLPHGPVISNELWEKVQHMVEELRERNDRNDTEPFIWSGTLKS